MTTKQSAFIKLILAGAIRGSIGVFRRYIDLSSGMLAMLRGFLGAATLFGVYGWKKGAIRWHVVKENWKMVLFSGIALSVNWILLFEAVQHTSVAVSTLCYYMGPMFVIMVSPMLFQEPITRRKAACVAAALVGIVLVSGVLGGGVKSLSEIKGILLGLGAAVLYATVVICNKKLSMLTASEKSLVQLFVAGVVLLPYNALVEGLSVSGLGTGGWAIVLILGIVHTGIAYALYFGCMSVLKAQTIAIFSYVDPVVAVFLSALVLRENIHWLSIVGGILVIGAAVASEIEPKK